MPLDSDIHNADANLHVRFYERSKDPDKSEPYVEIIIPGDQRTIIDQPAREHYRKRFARQWLSFQAQKGNAGVIGTPLEIWHRERPNDITDGQLMELQILKFQTVEQMAQATDAQCQRIGMGGLGLRTKALAYIAGKNSEIASTAMNKTNDKVAALEEQIAQLTAMLTAQPAAATPLTPKRRGPKPGFKRKVQLNAQHTPATGSAGSQ